MQQIDHQISLLVTGINAQKMHFKQESIDIPITINRESRSEFKFQSSHAYDDTAPNENIDDVKQVRN